jgi:hypothetical protein
VLRDQISKIERQQVNLRRSVSDLLDLQGGAIDRLDMLGSALTHRSATDRPPGTNDPLRLPATVERWFTEALAELDRFGSVTDVLAEEFLDTAGDGADNHGRSTDLPFRLRASDTFLSVGVSETVRATLRGFHTGVAAWFAALEVGTPVVDGQYRRLEQVCRRYETLFSTIPMFHIDRLAELTYPSQTTPGGSRVGLRWRELSQRLAGLGDEIYLAARSVTEVEQPG